MDTCLKTRRRIRTALPIENSGAMHQQHTENKRHQQTRAIRTRRCCVADNGFQGGAKDGLPKPVRHRAMMLSVAAAASRQCGLGAGTQKRYKQRQEEKRKQKSRHRPQTQALGARGTPTVHFATRHRPIAFYGAFPSSIVAKGKSLSFLELAANIENSLSHSRTHAGEFAFDLLQSFPLRLGNTQKYEEKACEANPGVRPECSRGTQRTI